ncbi:tetratricopeptide repeat protein [Acidicapsa ligni]|uniref:tetratricopeptide repeat protein n=1 Tax=Acidicapsa ligni TaxID=542300 RepID=UPI0021E0D43C|nr:hypothetical protein [Acidicapsa ligni]
MPIRIGSLVLAAGVCGAVGVPQLMAQSQQQAPPPSQQDNPFPEDSTQKQQGQAQPNPLPPDKTNPVPPASGSQNPFPGEDTNAPIIPVDPDPGAGHSGRPDYSPSQSHYGNPNTDGDPVRSPDPQGDAANDGFSSSRAGLKPMGDESSTDAKAGSSIKTKTRAQVLSEDINVGEFNLSSKNWRGAQFRFEDAYRLDPENEDAVWGLAEAERHLNLLDKAGAHYKLFLTYDPDGPHSRAARKALDEIESAKPAAQTQGVNLPK